MEDQMHAIARRTRRPHEMWESFDCKSVLAAKQRATKLGRDALKVYTPQARFFIRAPGKGWRPMMKPKPYWTEVDEHTYQQQVR